MCGICGRYDYRNKEPVSEDLLRRMASSIAHRGPDDEGYYRSSHGYGAGFRRLSIIDLAGGHQPMSDAEGRVWLVFNGEIFNYRELRAELEAKGRVFRTKTDTEVIIHGYLAWGDDVLRRLNGMFAFALWDDRAQRLLIARDRMGIKIVYYRDEDGILTFGSEIRAVQAGIAAPLKVSPLAVNLFLRYRYTPSPLTAYESIRKLAPGTLLVVEAGRVTVKRWWNYSPEPRHDVSGKEAVEALESLYEAAVERHLVSDVPVGLLLSGGVDSALLLALMNRRDGPRKTYSVGFGSSYKEDELSDARKSSALMGSEHSEVQIDRKNFEEALHEVIRCLEEPVATASIVPMYCVCRRAAEDVKVAFIGQGPDELFGGYKRHQGLLYGKYWRKVPDLVRLPLKKGLNLLPKNMPIKRALYSLDKMDRFERYQNVFSLESSGSIDGMFNEGLLPDNPGDVIFDCWADLLPLMGRTEELGGFQFLEIRSSLPDEQLMYADKLSMAHSLEIRVPYLDKEIVEYVETIPDRLKMKWWSRKLLHKKVAARFLPAEIIARKKRAFAQNVVNEWFVSAYDGKLLGNLRDPLSLIYNYLNYDAVAALIDEHRRGANDHHKLLFSLVVLEAWLRQ